MLDDEPVPQPPQLALDLDRRLAVALAAARQAIERHRFAPDDRDRCEVAELPALGAVDRPADHRRVLLQRDHRRARLSVTGDARLLPRSLDEDAERVSVVDDLAHPAHCIAVRLATADGDRPERADELTETRHLMGFGLAE